MGTMLILPVAVLIVGLLMVAWGWLNSPDYR